MKRDLGDGLPRAGIGDRVQFSILQPIQERFESLGRNAVESRLFPVEDGDGKALASCDGAYRIALQLGYAGRRFRKECASYGSHLFFWRPYIAPLNRSYSKTSLSSMLSGVGVIQSAPNKG